MSKFKIGDRVRVIEHPKLDNGQRKKIGEIGKVTDANSQTTSVKFDDGDLDCFCNYKLELVKHQYKVGDKVVLLGTKKECPSSWEDVCRRSNTMVGNIVTIDRIDSAGDLKFTSLMDYWFSPEDVKPFKHNESYEFGTAEVVVGTQIGTHTFTRDLCSSYDGEFKQEETKMELKDTGKGNRKEAMAQFKKEKASAEIEYCKRQLRTATDAINTQNRIIKEAEEVIAEYQKVIDEFKA